ncbi:MAG TPA: YegP family protein [Candidatus Saccharimonadales bacterium]|jgi:uncharacterized protein YegP (UPF0339 family)
MADPKFIIRQDKAENWRWTLKASNGETLGRSEEPFSTKTSCIRSVEAVVRAAEIAVIEVEKA